MSPHFSLNDEVHHLAPGPQGRETMRERRVYTVMALLPVEAEGRRRYRIRSKVGLIERIVTEEQISRATTR